MISMIACMTKNRVIGVENTLPWKQRNDMQRFKSVTWGHEVLMGRKTFESMGSKPLPGRTTVVVSRDAQFHRDFYQNVAVSDNDTTISDVEDFLQHADFYNNDVMIIGGAQIYKDTIQFAQRLYLTVLDVELEGDAFFPEFGDEWKLVAEEKYTADEKNQYGYNFLTYVRK